VLGSERQQTQHASSLYGSSQFSLVLGAKAGFFGSFDFSGGGQEQLEGFHIFKINFSNVFLAKIANHTSLKFKYQNVKLWHSARERYYVIAKRYLNFQF
jgi:hypothetical protein